MTLDTKPHTMPGTSLSSLVKGYLLIHRSEGKSPHTVAYYKGILSRFLWYAEKESWPDDARLLNQWQIREFLGYVGGEVNRWQVKGNRDKHAIIVTHEVVVKVLVAHVLGVSNIIYRGFEIGNASLSVIRVTNSSYQLATLNDTSHLE